MPCLAADFPDAFKANLWVQHLSDEAHTPDEALSEFTVRILLCNLSSLHVAIWVMSEGVHARLHTLDPAKQCSMP